MDEQPKQVTKDTEKFEGVGRAGTAVLASTVWLMWGHLIGMVATVASTFVIKKDHAIGPLKLGEMITYLEEHPMKVIPFTKIKVPKSLEKSPIIAGALLAGWLFGGFIGGVFGLISGAKDGDRGLRQFKRMQGKLNEALEENAALKEKIGEPKTPVVAANEPKPTVHADTLVKSESTLVAAEPKAQAVG